MNLDQEQQQLSLLPLQKQKQQQQYYHHHHHNHHNHHNHHHQQQQQQQQHELQQTTSMALMSSGEYVNFKPINTIATIKSAGVATKNPLPFNNTAPVTEMTISMDLPTPPLSESLLTPFQTVLSTTVTEGITTTTTTTNTMQPSQTTATFETMGVMTSSFKTPLLPMPTLEDIEDGVIYDQQQQQQQQQIIQTTQIPTGILKYSTMPATTTTQTTLITQHPTSVSANTTTTMHHTTTHRNASELNLPLGLVADCTSSTVVSHDEAALTTTAPTATIGTARHKYSALKTTADINNRGISSSCTSEIPISDVYTGIVKSNAALSSPPPPQPHPHPLPPPPTLSLHPPSTTTTTTLITNNALSTATIQAQGLRLKSSAASNAKLSQQRSTSCCCACFGKNPNDTHSTSDTKTKRNKRKTQTLLSALITNVGICALLLAYTFLGKHFDISDKFIKFNTFQET